MASSSSSTSRFIPSLAEYSNVDPTLPDKYTSDLLVGSSLMLLAQKKLCITDIERRIVLLKDEAEKNMPPIGENERMALKLHDLQTFDIWHFTFRCYADNNKRRSYYLENTGEYVRRHKLQRNDIIKIYRDDKGYFIIKTEKARVHMVPDHELYYEEYWLGMADLRAKKPRISELLSSWLRDDDAATIKGRANPAHA